MDHCQNILYTSKAIESTYICTKQNRRNKTGDLYIHVYIYTHVQQQKQYKKEVYTVEYEYREIK